ncbi:hypothetical protein GCM10010521_27300 [Streptomyces rameus]|uniref:MFS transporter n=1 Tax=Streptomyces rameus TaxID=68261 RepID=A0ABP6N9V2_9ACTN
MTAAETGDKRVPPWRGGFGWLWSAAVLPGFGDALPAAALPLLAASLTGEPLLIAAVSACGYLSWILFGLLGGAIADRVDQRRAMWTVDTARAPLAAAFFVLPVTALIPAHRPETPVAGHGESVATAPPVH